MNDELGYILEREGKKVSSALKLQELVKEKIKEIHNTFKLEVACCEGETCTVTEQTDSLLQSLVEESEQ